MNAITLAEAKQQIQIGSDLADAEIIDIAEGAEAWVSRQTGRLWTEQQITDFVDGGGRYLWLPQGPVISVSAVETAVSGTSVSSDLYQIVQARRLMYDYGRWPGGLDYWKVTYTAGYGSTYSIPADLKLLVLQLAARWFDNRKGTEREGSSGHSISWAALADSDMMITLQNYTMGSPA